MSSSFNWLGGRRTSKKSAKANGANGDKRSSRSSSRSAFHDDRDTDEVEMSIADSEYARKRRELLKFARSLEDLGTRAVIDMPRIVVIGAQSAGKSSLVEAVTGINVPRDSGTCTRCPMECTILTSGSAWSCRVSLRRVSDGEDRGTADFSPKLLYREDVELWIRRAQAAVLCPHIPLESIRNRSRDELKDVTDTSKDAAVLKFTRDVVVIDIEDPQGADLSFVDLPGLVQNEEEHLVALVEDLVQDYIKPDAAIILVTLPATDDLENQKAMRFARAADPTGKRTIGVVTKPDMLDEGATGKRESWKSIFEGRVLQHKLEKGYYCVRLPSDQERRNNTTRERLQVKERGFFHETSPWKALDSSHLGVRNLVHDISALLMDIIQGAIPKIQQAAAEHLANCLAELAALPSMMTEDSDATAEVVRCIFQFCESMLRIVDGHGDDKSFVRECRRRFRAFESAVRSTAPDFRPFLRLSESYPVALSGEDLPWREASRESVSGDSDILVADDSDMLGPSLKDEPMTLVDVQRVLEESIGWELPHNIPYEAKERLMKRFMAHWPTAADRCFEIVVEDLRKRLLAEAEAQFGRFPPLEKHMKPLLLAFLDGHVSRSRELLKNAVERESAPYGTHNNPYFEKMRCRWLARYKAVRAAHREGCKRQAVPPPPPRETVWEREQRALSALRALGITHLTANDLHYMMPLDEFEDVLIIMADVRSYFEVTYKRFADDIPEEIKANLLLGSVKGLQDHLVNELLRAPDAAQRLQKLVQEDPEIKRRRTVLQDRRRRLMEIKTRLDNFVL
ncbi:P-loop containing nucleoside triphosphate hydrolase protein [Trametes punicea]|nr:P-loop containing nucleoside triphosphate hydrolase protein [Trametes punicea]